MSVFIAVKVILFSQGFGINDLCLFGIAASSVFSGKYLSNAFFKRLEPRDSALICYLKWRENCMEIAWASDITNYEALSRSC